MNHRFGAVFSLQRMLVWRAIAGEGKATMTKKVWLGLVVLGAATATAAWFYANHKAESLIAEYIQQSNQQYLELAQQGDMPPIQMSYGALSANVLTSSYTIKDLKVSVAGAADLVSIGQAKLVGLNPTGLSEQGSALLQDIKLAPAMMSSLPPELADYFSALLMQLSYQYQYKPKTGELTFGQQFSINQQFQLSYSVAFTGVTQLWQFAEKLQQLSPEQQQQLAEQPDYVSDLMKIVAEVGIATGSFDIENKAFLQQLFEQLAAAGMTADYAATEQQLTSALQQNSQIPAQIRDPVLAFLKQPERLHMSFKLPTALTFAQMQDGSALEGIETTEDFLRYAEVSLKAN